MSSKRHLISALAALLCGCSPTESVEYLAHVARYERDRLPRLSSGPYQMEIKEVGTDRSIVQIDGPFRRYDRFFSSCSIHTITDHARNEERRWSDCGKAPEFSIRAARRPASTWGGRVRAQKLGRCRIAGEPGWEWRHKTEPTFKMASGGFETACITGDGIILREGWLSEEQVTWVRSEATRLARGPLPPGAFDPPDATWTR